VTLDDPIRRPAVNEIGPGDTLDKLFRRAATRRPEAIALIDPLNRESFTDGLPKRLTYAQADRMVSAIAGRLHRMGLRRDAIVGLQFANTVESVLVLLAVLRAGLIAMPLPLLWRRADAVAALNRVGAQALVVSGRVDEVDLFDLAMQVAAETFPIRFVAGFGRDPPDGVIALDDLYTIKTLEPMLASDPQGADPIGAGAHLAVVTWDVWPDGLVPVARSHDELIAGGLAVQLEGGLEQDAVILSTLTMSSFAGLASAMLPWLMIGGTLALHHPFDAETFVAQRKATSCDTLIVPGPLATQFAETGNFFVRDGLKRVLGVWRAPERLAQAPTWPHGDLDMIDLHVFGEIGLIAAIRDHSGRPAPILFGPVAAPRKAKDAFFVGEVQRSDRGTVALRGPMQPRCAFPPGVERTQLPHLKVAANGFIDTGYACLGGKGTLAMVVRAPPAGVVSVGGYRFVLRDLQTLMSRLEGDNTLATLPDTLAGYRLAGSAANPELVQDTLARLGVNPLIVDAFREPNRKVA
jgi:hypothetical protein